jgi:hypothetical protein
MQSRRVVSCPENIHESMACGWAGASIRGSTVRVLVAALSFAVMLLPHSPTWDGLIPVGSFID